MKQETKISKSKPKSIYLWDTVKKTIKRIESQIDLTSKKHVYMIPNIVPKTMKIFYSNIIILLENLCQ